MTTHLLVDFDSAIPNLALMQLSSWLKANGNQVALLKSDARAEAPLTEAPDEVWLSCVFTWNKEAALGAKRAWEARGTLVHLGGTGIDFEVGVDGNLVQRGSSVLPGRAGEYSPDYSLYDDDRAIGFSVRGCDRKCEFCVVPKKEGKIDAGSYRPLRTWVPEGWKKVLLLDNNIAQSPFHDEVLREAKESGLKLSISQGYDIRLVDEARAGMLADHKPWDLKFGERRLYFAWDYLGIEGCVRRGVTRLLAAGFKPRNLMCYILVGFNSTHEEDLHRFNVLRSFGVLPFCMPFNKRRDDPWLNAFTRFVNRLVYKRCTWEEYWFNPDRYDRRAGKPLEEFA